MTNEQFLKLLPGDRIRPKDATLEATVTSEVQVSYDILSSYVRIWFDKKYDRLVSGLLESAVFLKEADMWEIVPAPPNPIRNQNIG